MTSQDIIFETEFEKLNDFFRLKNTEDIHDFIEKHEKLLELLDKTKPYLKDTFPKGEFELEVYYDLSGEGNDHLLLNIYVDEKTFNNGFMEKIIDIDMKILPMKKEMDLIMALNLMPGINTNSKYNLN